jgi:hypothetical protein
MIAADIGEHIANHAERRNHGDSVRGSRRDRQQQSNDRDKTPQYQAFLLPIIGAKRRNEPAATSDIPNSNPAANTIAGPEGRLP